MTRPFVVWLSKISDPKEIIFLENRSNQYLPEIKENIQKKYPSALFTSINLGIFHLGIKLRGIVWIVHVGTINAYKRAIA